MTTERMDGLLMEAYRNETPDEIWHETCRARRVEQEQAETIQDQARLIVSLREQLRLANDKMAEQVRQTRWEVADTALAMLPTYERADYLQRVRDANAPND